MLGNHIPRPPNGYSIVIHSLTYEPVPGQGLATLIHSSIPYSKINIVTDLQAQAIRIHLDRPITVCNMYINPQLNVNENQITNIITQLPGSFILLGDFNAKHPLWGDNNINRLGRTIENMTINHNISILNNGSPTHLHIQTDTLHAIDLSICSSDFINELDWSVLDDLYGSDHFPITIKLHQYNILPPRPIKYKTKYAKWNEFKDHSAYYQNTTNFPINERYEAFIQNLQTAARLSIPRSSGKTRVRPVPWWNPRCAQLCAERKRALRRYQRTKLVADKILYKRYGFKFIINSDSKIGQSYAL